MGRLLSALADSPMNPTPWPFVPDPSAAPDWQSITHDVKCPLCGYNLRGLNEPRCPECGYPFGWANVLDPTKRRHPYLFEHHPERNVWSFFQTLFHNLNAIRFWRTLDPVQQLRVSRLMEYWLVGAMAALLPATVGAVEAVIHRLQWTHPRPGRLVRYLVQSMNGTRTIRWAVVASILLAVFPLLNFLALMIFQQSIRRRRIQAAHVLRCAVYGGDVILWYSLAKWKGASKRSARGREIGPHRGQ